MTVIREGAVQRRSNTLDPSELDGLLRIVTGSSRVNFIPADSWEYRDDLKAVMYPRESVMQQSAQVTSGQIYLKGGYAIHSQGKSDPWRHIDRAVTRANKTAGCEAVAPLSAQAVLFALEEERVENRQREIYPNLGNHSLPRRDKEYRRVAYQTDLAHVRNMTDIGSVTTSGVPQYWMRAATAAKLVGSEAISSEDLPEDMPWSEELVEQIRYCCTAETQDEMLIVFEKVVAGIAKSRIDSYEPPQTEDSSEESDSTEQQNDNEKEGDGSEEQSHCGDSPDDGSTGSEQPNGKNSSGNGNVSRESQSDEQTSDPENSGNTGKNSDESADASEKSTENTTPSSEENPEQSSQEQHEVGKNDSNTPQEKTESQKVTEAKSKINDETSATPEPESRDAIDFVSGDNSPSKTTEENTEEQRRSQKDDAGKGSTLKPNASLLSWEAIASTTTNIVAPVRRAVLQNFRDNERGEVVRRLRRGRYDVQTRMQDRICGMNRPEVCSRRSLPKKKSYDVYFLVDVSGSMGNAVEGTSVDFRVFGLAQNARWMMATRMIIAMSKVFDTTEGIRYAIGVHDEEYLHLKSFEEPLHATQRRRVLDHIGAYGGTSTIKAYEAIRIMMGRSHSERKILIHLTDGEIAERYNNGVDSVKEKIAKIQKEGTEVIVLTVGMGANNVRNIVGAERADEITDSTVGRILSKHLKRTLVD